MINLASPEHARYDVVGDVHGCLDLLRKLISELGYDERFEHPGGRVIAFVGDLVNRGPDSAGTLRLVCDLVEQGRAVSVLGNHDAAILAALTGNAARTGSDIARTLAEIDALPDGAEIRRRAIRLLQFTPLLLWLDHFRLLIVHASAPDAVLTSGIRAEYVPLILNGEAFGRTAQGKTVRDDWASEYRGDAFIVYGHTPQSVPLVRPNSVNIDTGALRGNGLTAFRWPEKVCVTVR